MSSTHPLQIFVDDELPHIAGVLDRVIDSVYQQWRHRRAYASRTEEEAARRIREGRPRLVETAIARLREDVEESVAAAIEGRNSRRLQPQLEMSLLDEELLSADIEISRVVQAVKSACESELLELKAYVAAMIGDRNLARNSNPLRPELFARALWTAISELPIERALTLRFLRDVADELASRLREVYAAACFRLAERGIEPAHYRTVVPLARPKALAELDITYARFDLRQLSQSIRAEPPKVEPQAGIGPIREPMAADRRTTDSHSGSYRIQAHATSAPLRKAEHSEVDRGDPKLIELVTRLFDAMRNDRRMPEDVGAQVMRLMPIVKRLVASEPQILDSHDHPVWRFLSRLAFAYATRVDGDDDDGAIFAERLVDELATGTGDDSTPFALALRRLANFEQESYDRRLEACEPQIERLRSHVARTAPMSTRSAPLDIGGLDTVPLRLLPAEDGSAADSNADWVERRKPGNWIRALIKGEWRRLQLLWIDESGEIWLLAEVAVQRHWALRKRAIKTLAGEALASALMPRSLVRSAASRVIRALETQAPAE